MKCNKRIKEKVSDNRFTQDSINHSIEELVLEHGKFVKSFIARLAWNEQNVDDIYQSTLLEAIKSFPKFRNESQPRTWLCGIAHNIIRNYSRKLNTIRNYENLEVLDSTDIDNMSCMTTEDPAKIYTRERFARQIKKASSKLPHSIRQTFFLVVDSGKNYEQAAQLLNVPVGTVRSRISRAREVLKGQCIL